MKARPASTAQKSRRPIQQPSQQGSVAIVQDYQWDVFLSYRNEPGVSEWVPNLFLPVLEERLRQAGLTNASIFFDKNRVETGDYWAKKIVQCLQASRVLVAVWTPEYFESRWCIAEFEHFLGRLKQMKHSLTVQTLIFPVVYSNGELFPAKANDIQQRKDFVDYAYPDLRKNGSELSIKFQDAVRELAGTISKAILPQLGGNVPRWRQWKVPDPAKVKTINVRAALPRQ